MNDHMELVGRLELEAAHMKATPRTWDVLTEAAACIREMVEWRPIETAPRDGAWVQAWRAPAGPDGGSWEPLVYVRWDEDGEEWVWPDSTYEVFTERGQERANRMIADYENFSDNSFTHWLPLPPAPGAEDE